MDRYRQSEALQIEPSRPEVGACALSLDARIYARESRASKTARAYASDLRVFTGWCLEGGRAPFPVEPAMLANYVAWLATQGRSVATIERAVAAISQFHVAAGLPSPRADQTFRQVMKGVRRHIGVKPRKKSPVLIADLDALVAATNQGVKGVRDRALLALGFAGALRRTELVGLDVGDLNFTVDGLIVTLRRSKGDQEAAGVSIGIPRGERPECCAVRLTSSWLSTLNAIEGPLFRSVNRHGTISTQRLSGKAVASVIQTLAPVAGLQATSLGAHSLRSGFATAAVRAGKPEHLIMRHTRHRSVTVFRGYVASANLFVENAAAGIGL